MFRKNYARMPDSSVSSRKHLKPRVALFPHVLAGLCRVVGMQSAAVIEYIAQFSTSSQLTDNKALMRCTFFQN